MATSLGQLIELVERESRSGPLGRERSVDALGALAGLGRLLRRVAIDGLDSRVNGEREVLVRTLAEACSESAQRMNVDQSGRLTRLAGVLADAVRTTGADLVRGQRWLIAVRAGELVPGLVELAADADRRRGAVLGWTALAAAAVHDRAARDVPRDADRNVLGRTVPQSAGIEDLPPLRRAVDALSVITTRLGRMTLREERPATLLEVFSVSRAAQATAAYAAAVSALSHGGDVSATAPAAEIWREFRDQLRPFVSAAPLRVEDRDLGQWAQRTHAELRRGFGPIATIGAVPIPEDAGTELRRMIGEVPLIARRLRIMVTDLADRGDLHALAQQLPFREVRLGRFLENRPVVADRADLNGVEAALVDADVLAGRLGETMADDAIDSRAGGGRAVDRRAFERRSGVQATSGTEHRVDHGGAREGYRGAGRGPDGLAGEERAFGTRRSPSLDRGGLATGREDNCDHGPV